MSLPVFVKVVAGMPTIDIGAMRHEVDILSLGPTSPATYDDAGPIQISTALTGGPYWAAIGGQASGAARNGLDVIHGGSIISQLPLIVAMWFDSRAEPNMQIRRSNGAIYVIQSIENVLEMDVVMVLTCLGIGANG